MKDKTSVTSSLSNKDTLTDAQINAGFGFNTILESPDLNGQLYDIDSQVNILTKELCNFLIDNGVTINANDNTQVSTLLTSLFGAKQDTLVAGNNITIDENNVISAEGSAPANIPLFFNTRFPIAPNNVSWVNSANYSWLYGSTYVDAYKLLTDQFTPVGKFTEGDSYYICTFSDGEIITTTVPVNSGDLAQLETWCSSQGYTYSGATIEEFECYKTVSTSSETIGGTTITFYRTRNKMKIVDTTQEGYLDTIFNSTGVAEYFLIDTVNERFKLPRNKWGYYGTGTGELGNYISESLPNIKNKSDTANLCTGNINTDPTTYDTGALYHSAAEKDGIATVGSATYRTALSFDASRSSSVYQDNAPVQPRGSKGDLYFYVGAAGADVVAEIAGIKAETINNKADRNLRNVDVSSGADAVIEFQAPTAGNNYTWYRKYASGWIEQGGIENHTNAQSVLVTVILPIEMADTNYIILACSGRRGDTSDATRAIGYYNLTTTGFGLHIYRANDWTSQSTTCSWRVEGMAAV